MPALNILPTLEYQTTTDPMPGRPVYTLCIFPADPEKAPKRIDFHVEGNTDDNAKTIARAMIAEHSCEKPARQPDLYDSTPRVWRKVWL